jgi:hypothetical protein
MARPIILPGIVKIRRRIAPVPVKYVNFFLQKEIEKSGCKIGFKEI